MGGNEYELADGYVVSKCYEDFPTLYFLFDGYWVGVYPDEYVVDVSEKQDRSMCVLLLSQGDHSFMVMGNPLFQDYYTVHDDEKSRIGFAPTSISEKSALEAGSQPSRAFGSDRPPRKPMSIWTWVICSALILAVAAAWVAVILKSSQDDDIDRRRGDDREKNIWVMIGIAVVTTLVWSWIVLRFFRRWINDLIVPDV